MTWDKLSMVNFHRAANGSWSYTAYLGPQSVFRSNKDLPDPLECLLEIAAEMDRDAELVSAAMVKAAAAAPAVAVGATVASGGRRRKNASPSQRRTPGRRKRRTRA